MNSVTNEPYLTTKELAVLLRIKERKVYDMASTGEVPCVRVVGKLLFPRAEILRWIHASHSGPQLDATISYPATLVGSHDPLLEWALRESQCGLASSCDGSQDGLVLMAQSKATLCGTHLYEGVDWNIAAVREHLSHQPVVMVAFARRCRGLILTNKKSGSVAHLEDLKGLNIAQRQASAASQQLFEVLLKNAGVSASRLNYVDPCARTEDELGMLVFEGKADAAFGLESVARRLQLAFVPQLQERFDLVIWRKAWFDESFQILLRFMQGGMFQQRAAEMGGYDVSMLGDVRYNSPAGG